MSQHPFIITSEEDDPIRGDVHVPDGTERHPVIVLCHGFKGFKDWGCFPHAAETLANAGFTVVRFNFSCNGIGEDLERFTELEKFSRNTFSRELSDLQQVLDAIEQEALPQPARMDTAWLGVHGHSRGGAIALLTAASDARVKALVTWSSVPTLFWYEDQHDLWRDDGYLSIINSRTGQELRLGLDLLEDMTRNRDRLNVLAHAAELTVPTLIIHGSEDATVPVKAAYRIHQAVGAADKDIRIIDGAGHTFEAVHPFTGSTPALDEALAATRDWFIKKLQ